MITGKIYNFYYSFKISSLLTLVSRKYIINRLRSLTQLDSDPVTEKERVEAIKIYGQLQTSVALDQEEREKEAREREEKEKSRYQREKELAEKRKEEVKKKRLRKLQLQKEKRDALKESNEEKKEETEEEKTPEEKLASILPEVDERTNIADRNVPLLVANIDGVRLIIFMFNSLKVFILMN